LKSGVECWLKIIFLRKGEKNMRKWYLRKCMSIILTLAMMGSFIGVIPAFAVSLSPYDMPEAWTGESATGFARGEGTESNPYEIATAEQLAYLADQVNGGNTYEGKYIKLTNDIVLNSYAGYDEYGGIVDKAEDLLNENNSEKDCLPFEWTPIGYIGARFEGSFNGNRHVVSGLLIEQAAENSANGLFGVIGSSGTVERLGIVNLYIDTSTVKQGATGAVTGYNLGRIEACYSVGGTIEGYQMIGGIAGYISGNLYDCHNACDLQIGNNTSFNFIGGIVGISDAGEIEGCYNTGEVYGSGFSVGGIVGHTEGDTAANLITACYNTGAVEGYGKYVGGIAGYFDHGTLDSCSNSGAVNGDDLDIGGIVGYAHGNDHDISILNCSNSGEVTGPDEAIGGIVGHLNEVEGGSCTVQYCYNAGAVSGPGVATRIGGIAGNLEGTPSVSVADCYYDKDVSAVGGAIGGDEASVDDDANKVIGKTTDEMKTETAFDDWDTSTIWYFDADGYPELMPIDTNNRSQLSIAYADVGTDDAYLYFASSEAGTITYSVKAGRGIIVDEDDSGNLSAVTGMNLLEIDNLAPATTYEAYVEVETTVGNTRGILVEFTTGDLSATLTPASELMEGNLDTNSLSVTLEGDGFWDETLDKANFTLNNAPSGLTVESLDFTDWTHCTINLAFDGTDFSTDVTNFSVTIAGEELDSDSPLTSNTLTISMAREWAIVGTAGFSTGMARYNSSAADSSGTPYVAYSDWGNDNKVSVKKLNAAGTSWELVGNDGFSAGRAENVSLAIDSNDTLYVAYVDQANNPKVTVMKYDGTSWEAVGSVGFTEETASQLSLALDSNNVPYVAYSYQDEDERKVKVQKYNGTNWVTVGTGGFSAATGAETTEFIRDVDFGIDGTTPYIAYSGMWGGNQNIRPVVMTYNESDWVVVGANVIADVDVIAIDLVVDSDGNLYVAYMQGGGAIKLWQYSESAWNDLSSGTTYIGYTTASDVSLAVDGNKYISFGENDNNLATVVKFSGSESSVIGDAKFTADSADYQSLVIGANKTPYLAFNDGANSYKLTVMGYLPVAGDTTAPSLTAGAVSRTSDTEGTIKFTSDEVGSYYYDIVADGASAPVIDTSGAGIACTTAETTISNPTGLTAGARDIYIQVKDGAGNVSNALKIDIAAYVAPSSGSRSSRSNTTPQPSQESVIVIVNGKEQDAGKETKTTEEGESIVTVEVNNNVIDSSIDEAIKNNTMGTNNVIQVMIVDTESEVAKVELTGDIIKKLEENTFDVSVKRGDVEYVIPAEEFTISKVAENLGIAETDLEDIKVEVKITKLDEKVVSKYNEIAKANSAELVFPPVSFEVVAKNTKADGTTKEVEINKFNNYVERVMEIPAGVDPSKITTGIVFNTDGTYNHVPTEIFQKEGKWYAKLNSLTNSDYSVIWNPITVKSVENHWSKDAVNDMASRLVIFNTETFEPDKAITRADFAEYIVRALGIYKEGTHENNFNDVSVAGDRTLAILIANEYGIVTGYADGTFKGDNQITREEAMTMYQRAMKVTQLTGSDTDRYQSYADYSQVGKWATAYVQEVLAAHVFNGTTATTISPKASLTYGESAQAIKNLLVESKLINQ
jgi:hypothetical protein